MSGQRFLGKLTKCAALALVFGVVGGTAFSGANYFMDSNLNRNQNLDTEQGAAIDYKYDAAGDFKFLWAGRNG